MKWAKKREIQVRDNAEKDKIILGQHCGGGSQRNRMKARKSGKRRGKGPNKRGQWKKMARVSKIDRKREREGESWKMWWEGRNEEESNMVSILGP